MKREVTVGLVIIILVSTLLAMTLWIQDPRFLSDAERTEMRATFREVAGLRVGSKVWIYGAENGRVESIEPDGKGSVEVFMTLDYDPELRENAVVKIQPSSALGGAVVAIHPGDPSLPRMQPGIVTGQSQGDALGEIGRLAADLRGPALETIQNLKKVTEDVASRSDSIVANLEAFSTNAKDITESLQNGQGSIGKLFQDEGLYEDLRGAISSLQQLADDANGGGGALDMLLHDQQMATDLRETVASLKSVSDKIDQGEGSLARLLNDPTLYDSLTSAAADLQSLTTEARDGDGAFGRLLNDPELANRLDRITDDVAQVTGKLRRGEGTLGKLIQDEDLYEELRGSLKELTAGAGDARENAPILTFAAFLFGAF